MIEQRDLFTHVEHSNPTQAARILDYLRQGHRLTPLQSLNMFGCMRLASRISELKKAGHQIAVEIVTNGKKRYAEYRLETNGKANK